MTYSEGAETGLKEPIKIDSHVLSKVEQRGILAGMLLGDGRRSQKNFYIQYPARYEDYLLYKKEVLEKITRKPAMIRRSRNRQGGELLRLEPKLIPLTRILVGKLYKKGNKAIARKFLNLLTPQGIAIWFCDSGSKSFKKKDGKIHALEVTLNTYLSKEENEIIVSYFSEKWGFKWGLSKSHGSYCLRMGTKEGKKFLTFITPYVHESKLYKVNTSSNTTATT